MRAKAAKTPHSGKKRPEARDPRPKGLKRLYKAKKDLCGLAEAHTDPFPQKTALRDSRRPNSSRTAPGGLTKPKPLQKGRTEAVWGKIGASRPLRGGSWAKSTLRGLSGAVLGQNRHFGASQWRFLSKIGTSAPLGGSSGQNGRKAAKSVLGRLCGFGGFLGSYF